MAGVPFTASLTSTPVLILQKAVKSLVRRLFQTVRYGSTGYGYYVIVDHGGGYKTLYGHLSAIYVTPGQAVAQGTPVGAVGSTGNSTGPHLHFEIRAAGQKVDPMQYLKG